jgi:rfaE bifunctional protein nucleotidyltransferase chain/domain
MNAAPNLPIIIGRQACKAYADNARRHGQTIVFVNGCFDLLHPGHVQVFFDAKEHGDCLIVALNSDDSIKRLKGPNRPIMPEDVRMTMVASLKPVAAAFCFDEDNASNAIRFMKPHVYAKGAQYRGQNYPERDVVSECQVKLVFLNHVAGFSTSSLIERICLSETDI